MSDSEISGWGSGWVPFTSRDYVKYTSSILGDYAFELDEIYFTDMEKTTYLAAIKWNARLIWNEYFEKQNHKFSTSDTDQAIVNTDVLNTALLSLHPRWLVQGMDNISSRTKDALEELAPFRPLILLEVDGYPFQIIEKGMEAIPRFNYSFMECLMGWFLTLTSKMTGLNIPGVDQMTVGGRIEKERSHVESYIHAMINFAEAMAEQKNWNVFAQYSMVRKMLDDLKTMGNIYINGDVKPRPNETKTDDHNDENIADNNDTHDDQKESKDGGNS